MQVATNMHSASEIFIHVLYETHYSISNVKLVKSQQMTHHGVSNYIHCKAWGEITYVFLNFNGCTVGLGMDK